VARKVDSVDSLLWDTLLQFEVWPQIIVMLGAAGGVYAVGWRRLRERGFRRLANGWRLTAFVGGLFALGVAMLSFIEVLQDLLFTVHMVQHILINTIGPLLLLVADPFPALLWGLPLRMRRALVPILGRHAAARRLMRRYLGPWVCWGLFVGSLWMWHTPGAYDIALRSEFMHLLQHTMYFVTAMLFWWHVTNATPRIWGRHGYGFRIGYLLAALAQNEVLGVLIALAREPLYHWYTTVPRLWGLSVMDDQTLGGAIMWVPGGMMYALAAVVLLARFIG
jgi:putative membrane protein